MNILILTNNDVSLYKSRKELIAQLLERGDEVYLSLPSGKFVQKLIDMGCKYCNTVVDRRGKNAFADIKLILHYFRIMHKVKPDIVILYTIKPNLYGGFVSRLKGIPYVINITGLGTVFEREGFIKKVIKQCYGKLCKSAKAVLFENQENRKIFIDNDLVEEENAILLNGAGVNLEEYAYSSYPEESEIHFLFVGRIMKEKGINELFAVAELIKEVYRNVVFDIAGWMEENYEERINGLEVQGVIKFWGFQEDIRPLIKQSHCVILPSYHEGMANILLEASAMGRPLITSNIHGCMEAIYNNKNGYLVEPADAVGLYRAVEDFINKPFQEKRKMGVLSREHMKSNFNRDTIVKETLNYL